MKRPKWASEKRYKIVHQSYSKGIYESPVPVTRRALSEGLDRGLILEYSSGKVTYSPNGVCEIEGHDCCRGIHAWRTKEDAQKRVSTSGVIVIVYAMKWYGVGDKCRTQRVWVGEIVE